MYVQPKKERTIVDGVFGSRLCTSCGGNVSKDASDFAKCKCGAEE